jgi:FAD/FMN-containing dehydrogenase
LDTAAWAPAAVAAPETRSGVLVNDVHSRLNPTRVADVVRPRSVEEARAAILRARAEGVGLSVAGARHSMGGQQFGSRTLHVDMSLMDRVLAFDRRAGWVDVEGGILWPRLVSRLLQRQEGEWPQWTIRQKQTGADRLSVGGALSSNIHGRGLALEPFVSDVEEIDLLDGEGELRTCSREIRPDLFRLAAGGYGLFGLIVRVRLRLTRRRKLQRIVEIGDVDGLIPAFEDRIGRGFLYGDFQYRTDASSPEFLKQGVFSCYRPIDDATPLPERQSELSADDWRKLYHLAHVDPAEAFRVYSRHYLATSGQVYWSDLHQMGVYLDGYHLELDARLGRTVPSTEMLTELYVPRRALSPFLSDVREDLRRGGPPVIYGTIRLIEKDPDSFLAWAREPWVCVVFNLCVTHRCAGVREAVRSFRRLIDRAIAHGGSFFLTYHRWATRRQIRACYPQFEEFLRLKRAADPADVFRSDWYRHYREMFAGR